VSIIIESIVLGILTGGVYALMASGLTLIYGVLDIINVAQAIFVILGAYLSFELEHYLHIDLFLGLLITMPTLFLLGVVVEKAFLSRIKENRPLLSILILYAVAQIVQGGETFLFTGSLVQLQAPYIDASFPIWGFHLTYMYVFSFALSIVLLAMLYLLVYQTKFGYGLRASMQNRVAATLIGINVEWIQTITFGIGIALSAAGGLAFGATNAFNSASSLDLISLLFVIIVLGGMGSLKGALIASFAMLIIQDVTAVVWQPVWSSTVFFVLLVALLVFRPQGLFGLPSGRKQ
jgi:branched-chain amino acid transport system permease protein